MGDAVVLLKFSLTVATMSLPSVAGKIPVMGARTQRKSVVAGVVVIAS
jgi:hypothetical protein